MHVSIEGLDQGTIEVELQSIPREGESIRILYGSDAEVFGKVTEINHYVNQHAGEHKIRISIRPID